MAAGHAPPLAPFPLAIARGTEPPLQTPSAGRRGCGKGAQRTPLLDGLAGGDLLYLGALEAEVEAGDGGGDALAL
jgi:hypothetical protein